MQTTSSRGPRAAHSGKRKGFRSDSYTSSRPSSSTRGGRHSGFSRGRKRGRPKEASFDISLFINKDVAESKPEKAYIPKHTFGDFGFAHEIVSTLSTVGFKTPTPIQDQTITPIMEGRDVVGLANTGTGKTGAFLLPLIHQTLSKRTMQTLILAPTRELAIQIEKEFRLFSKGTRLYSVTCVGGAPIGPQLRALRQFNHFIIGTPGRIQDLIDRGALKLGNTKAVVLDEADRMLDMGFIAPIRSILKETPREHQTLFFSATMSDDIKKLIHDFLKDPVTVSVIKQDVATSIEQDVVRYGSQDKIRVLIELLKSPSFDRVLVFGRTKHGVERLARDLAKNGIRADSIHGDKSHGSRQRALTNFKSGSASVLVATDVAARGIHIDKVSHVINYDLPGTHEDYIHRIGRTGRGTQRGKALTFVK